MGYSYCCSHSRSPVFIAVNEGIVLVPEAAIPMLVVLDDQL
jgi:hypothetical protein